MLRPSLVHPFQVQRFRQMSRHGNLRDGTTMNTANGLATFNSILICFVGNGNGHQEDRRAIHLPSGSCLSLETPNPTFMGITVFLVIQWETIPDDSYWSLMGQKLENTSDRPVEWSVAISNYNSTTAYDII